MKKIVALGAAAALVGALFAAEPVSNPSVVEFTGNAEVKWGVDLDAGKTGFSNGTWTRGKFKLFDAGDKSTSGEGLWAELLIKIDADSDVGPNGYVVENGGPGAYKTKHVYVDVAKIHFNDFYVGIKSGDTTVGVLDFNTAVRSGDPWFHPGRWLGGVNVKNGTLDYTQGIVAGYDNSNLEVAVDFRSLAKGQYTDAYAVKLVAGLKDSNEFVPGLKVGAGASYDISDFYYDGEGSDAGTAGKKATKQAEDYTHKVAYAGNFGYKFKIDDKFYVYPQAGINGTLSFTDNPNTKAKSATNDNTVVASLLFGWGDTNSYGSSGLPYFDVDDREKGVTPGLSVLAYIPLATVANGEAEVAGTITKSTTTTYSALQALIVPSFYSGDLIKNFKASAYSEIALFNTDTSKNKTPAAGDNPRITETHNAVASKDAFAFAIGGALSYAIKLKDDAITVTPKVGARFINEAYNDQKATIQGKIPAAGINYGALKPFFTDYGIQGVNNKDFLNITGSVDVAGLINNTTFSVTYVSANLLNDTVYNDPTYNVKAGTLNVGCKIAF